jgi:hypothetical protein
MPFRGIIAFVTVKGIESGVADRGFWLEIGRAIEAWSYRRAGEPTIVTLDITAVPCIVPRSCMNNTLLRKSIWWSYMIGSRFMRSAKRLLVEFVLSSLRRFHTVWNC